MSLINLLREIEINEKELELIINNKNENKDEIYKLSKKIEELNIELDKLSK